MRRVQFVKRHSINDQRDQRDQGSALILALVLIMVGTMMVLPVMKYTMSVTRANRTTSQVADRTEAVKAGLRVALYDTVALYQACNPTKSGPNVSVDLAVPPGLGIKTWCTRLVRRHRTCLTNSAGHWSRPRRARTPTSRRRTRARPLASS